MNVGKRDVLKQGNEERERERRKGGKKGGREKREKQASVEVTAPPLLLSLNRCEFTLGVCV